MFEELSLKLAQSKMRSSKKQRFRIYRKLQGMMEMNEPLPTALDRLWRNVSEDGTKTNKPAALAVQQWLERARQGLTLAEMLDGWVPGREHMLLRAGEESGNVAKAITSIMAVDEAAEKMRRAIMSAVTYPAFIFLLLSGVLWMFGVNLIEPMRQNTPPEVFAGMAGIASVSDFVRDNGLYTLIGIGFFVFLIATSLPLWRGKFRAKLDMFPPYSWYRIWQGSAFLLSMSALLSAQVPLRKCFEILLNGAKPWLNERLEAARQEILRGRNLGEALRVNNLNFPDPALARDLEILAERADVARTIESLAKEWLEEQTRNLNGQASMVRTVGMGLVGGFIAWAMMSIVGISQSIANQM
jgi:type II secretory pathway component PulF